MAAAAALQWLQIQRVRSCEMITALAIISCANTRREDDAKAAGERRIMISARVSAQRALITTYLHILIFMDTYMRPCMRCFDWLFTYDGHVLDGHHYAQLGGD